MTSLLRTHRNALSMTLLVALLFCAALLSAENLTPQLFVQIDTEVRAITLDGMRKRVELLSGGTASAQQETLLYESNRQQVTAVYRQHATTAAAHSYYAAKRSEDIDRWLEANPDWQYYYNQLDRDFESLSAQLGALQP